MEVTDYLGEGRTGAGGWAGAGGGGEGVGVAVFALVAARRREYTK